MPATLGDAFVVSVEGAPDFFVKATEVRIIDGVKFVNINKTDKMFLEWVTGGRKAWNRSVSAAITEIVDIRNKAAERMVLSDPLPMTASAYKLRVQSKRVAALVESRCTEAIEITLPRIECDGEAVGPQIAKTTMRCAGGLQLQLAPAVMNWLWHRCRVPADDEKRNVPGTAAHECRGGVYWHRQKRAFIATKKSDAHDPHEQKHKLFRPLGTASEVDVVQIQSTLDQATAWNSVS